MNSGKTTNYLNNKNPSDMPRDEKLEKIQSNIKDVTIIMRDNIDKVLERGQKIEDLDERAQSLDHHAVKFRDTSWKLRKKMCIDNAKKNILIVIFVLLVIGVLVGIIYEAGK